MNRKKFIESCGATCSNWTWSWSFVNHKDRVVIFGAWDYHAKQNSYLILNATWEVSDKGRKQPGYSQAREHIELVQKAGYALMTFTMYPSDKHKDENGHGPAKIRDFERRLTLRTLKQVKQKYFAVELSAAAAPQPDDTMNDLPGVDYSDLGADGSKRIQTQGSSVKRDPRVRRKVIDRARNGCERSGCADKRTYSGFLDVHHILGVEASDRVWTCVALCPNCHRESHFSPDRDKINEDLLAYALRFKAK